jgi:hypothetical protein
MTAMDSSRFDKDMTRIRIGSPNTPAASQAAGPLAVR